MNGSVHLVSIGNTLRGNDGVAQSVCQSISESVLKRIKFTDLGPYTNLLEQTIDEAQTVVIVDAIHSLPNLGDCIILTLPELLSSKLNVASTHGFSFADELNIVSHKMNMDNKQVLFFGIETGGTETSQPMLSKELQDKIPALSQKLCDLLESILDA
jgi:hydrogenase maturation protease